MVKHAKLVTLILSGSLLLPVTSVLLPRNYMCWKNNIGIRECGASVPPEYSQSRIEVVNDRGLVIRVIEAAKTPEQLAREKEQKYKREQEEAMRKERARQDAILLNAYTTERDLIIARDTNLKAAQGQIDISKGNLKLMQTNLLDMQEQAANFERSGKKPPEKLVEQMKALGKQIEEKQRVIEQKEAEKKDMEFRYKRDLERFRQLKGGRIQ